MNHLERFQQFESLGLAALMTQRIQDISAHTPLFEDFTDEELARLGAFMPVYRAPAQAALIVEGETGDFMMLVIEGMVDITRQDKWGNTKRIAVVTVGQTLGEMSMLDGEPRFASCTALEPTTFAILDRAGLQSAAHAEPRLATKILMKLVLMMSQRLRQTSAKLVNYIEK